MRIFIFGCNEQTWTYFLPAVEGGPNSLLWQYLALPSGDENYFANSAGGGEASQAGRPTQL